MMLKDTSKANPNQLRYNADGEEALRDKRKTVCYCRVSSTKQRDDLERQVAYMRSIYPAAEVIRDLLASDAHRQY